MYKGKIFKIMFSIIFTVLFAALYPVNTEAKEALAIVFRDFSNVPIIDNNGRGDTVGTVNIMTEGSRKDFAKLAAETGLDQIYNIQFVDGTDLGDDLFTYTNDLTYSRWFANSYGYHAVVTLSLNSISLEDNPIFTNPHTYKRKSLGYNAHFSTRSFFYCRDCDRRFNWSGAVSAIRPGEAIIVSECDTIEKVVRKATHIEFLEICESLVHDYERDHGTKNEPISFDY